MRHALAGLIACSCISTYCCISVCSAQDDAIVVNATRFPEDARKLPASATVITAQDIAQSAARTLPELLQEQVGITMKDFFGNNASTTSIDLRGYGITGAQNTLILLDGRRLNDFDLSGVQWAAIPLASIDRIEILRGTGAVLYGDAASAGVVNIVTRSPLREGRSVEAFGRIASYGTFEGQLYGSAAGSAVGVNGSVYGYTSQGYRLNNRDQQQNNTLNLRWALGEGALDLRVGDDRQYLRLPGGRFVQSSIGLNEYATDPRGTDTPLDYAKRDGARIGLTLTQRLGDVELSAGLDHRDKQTLSYFDQSGFPAYRDDKVGYDAFTPRARIPFALAGMQHRLTIGADWYDWRYVSRRTDTPAHIGQPTNIATVKQSTAGYYAQDSIDVTRSTVATLGARLERAKYSGDDLVDPNAPACFFCTGAAPLHASQNEHAWELGLRQGLGARWSAFARAGRSFRLATSEEVYENDIFFNPQFQLLRPQHSNTVEAGAEWHAGANSARAALFR